MCYASKSRRMECGQEMDIQNVVSQSVTCADVQEYNDVSCDQDVSVTCFCGHTIENGSCGNRYNVPRKFFGNPLYFKKASIVVEKNGSDRKKVVSCEKKRLIDAWSPFTSQSGKNISQLKTSLSQCLNSVSKDSLDRVKSDLRAVFSPFFRPGSNSDKGIIIKSCKTVFSELVSSDNNDKFSQQLSCAVENLDPRILYGTLVDVVDLRSRNSNLRNNDLSVRGAKVF